MLAQNSNIYLPQLNCRLDNFNQKMIFFVSLCFYFTTSVMSYTGCGWQTEKLLGFKRPGYSLKA